MIQLHKIVTVHGNESGVPVTTPLVKRRVRWTLPEKEKIVNGCRRGIHPLRQVFVIRNSIR